jgi:TolB-like protein/DNA-binding SARP family transcriptional activator
VFTLRLLGTASIDASHGPVTGRAAQGRRLALLAVLALARGRSLTRDKLIALLWPEATPDRARPQLSDTLYILRHALGEGAVRSVGDGLALNAAAVTSDVEQFEQLLENGRLEDAVSIYGGPLLDGFHVPDSVEFETWLDGERAELARHYGRALETLAAAAAADGSHTAAVGWWRRRAALDPYNSGVALALMHALDAAGGRAGAIQHARIHATLLREELDAEPDAAVAAFAERLRREPRPSPEPAPSGPPASFSAIPVSTSTPAFAPSLPAVSAEAPAAPPRRARRVLATAAVLMMLALGAAYVVYRMAEPAPARSVGVLPFVNMSPDPANSYFSDGLSEQIIHGLSRIDGLRVAARTSSFALRERELSVRAIADTLDVQAVLEGSVLVSGDRLRVIAQLIDARTGFHIWADQYEGELRDAFALQDSVAAAIAIALHLRLAGSMSNDHRPPSLAAYDLYLRGLYLRNSLSADALRQAAEYFDRAIELEPRFALAWAAKASVTAPQAYFRYVRRDSVVDELRVLTARALELDPTLGEAHVALAELKLFYEWDWDAAGAALRRAIDLNPNDAHAWHQLANYHSAMTSSDDALAARERAVQLDPLNARARTVFSRELMIAGQHERALAEWRRAEQLDPVHPLLLGLGPRLPVSGGEVYLRQGREVEAVEAYLRVASLRGATVKEIETMRATHASSGMPGFWKTWLEMDLRQSGPSPDPVRMAHLHLLSGDTARALDWLDRAFDERNPALIYLRRDPVLAGVLAHPRVRRIAREMKFPD